MTRTPQAGGATRGIALWLPYLGGTKDVVRPVLERLAGAGCVRWLTER